MEILELFGFKKKDHKKCAPQDRAFLNEVKARIGHAVFSASETPGTAFLSDGNSSRKKVTVWKIEGWLEKEMDAESEHYEENLRFLRALHAGFTTGSLALDDLDDVFVFSSVFRTHIWRLPQAVEYYVGRGELLDVVRMFESSPAILADPYAASPDHPVLLRRLYENDMSMNAEKVATDEVFDVPLEIRAAFAGLDDPLSDAEDRQKLFSDYSLSV